MEPRFSVYTVDTFISLIQPLVVTTVYRNPGGYLKAEYFVSIPNDGNKFVAGRNSTTPGSEAYGMDEACMSGMVIEQARNALSQYMRDRYNEAEYTFLPTPKLVDAGKTALQLGWITGKHREQLTRILQRTECEPLISELKIIAQLPSFQHTDISGS